MTAVWSICRVDKNPYSGKISLFEVQAASRKADLDMEQARQSGFVSQSDQLVVVSPSGKIQLQKSLGKTTCTETRRGFSSANGIAGLKLIRRIELWQR